MGWHPTLHELGQQMAGVLQEFIDAAVGGLPALVIAALVFSVLGLFATACNKGAPWWRKPDLATDIAYSVLIPGLMHYGRLVLLISGIVLFYHIADHAQMAAFFDQGHGVFAGMPFWVQVAAYLLVGDFLLYATHRLFHTASLWRYHAVHHSSEHLEWISSQRFHPVDLLFHSVIADVALMLMGVSPDVLIWLAPYTIGNSVLLHANLDWTYGPLRYVLMSPVAHRWHHTGYRRGGNKNFGANFTVFDVLFGTFYMPEGVRPDGYGVGKQGVPADLGRQLLYPFRRRRAVPKPAPETALPLKDADKAAFAE